jgi:hypothetical protein
MQLKLFVLSLYISVLAMFYYERTRIIVLYMKRFQNVVLERLAITVKILVKVVYLTDVICGMAHVQTKVAVNLDGNPSCPCVI